MDEGNTNLYWIWVDDCLGNTYQLFVWDISCLYGIYDVWDISCQPMGEECTLGCFFATLGRVIVKCTFLKKQTLLVIVDHIVDIVDIVDFVDDVGYWIFTANSLGHF